MLWIPHQLVGSPLGRNVTLECFTEAHPNALTYWTREDGQMIHSSKKYHTIEIPQEVSYKVQMMLTIVKLKIQDFGTYKCVAKNSRGETDGTIRLYASALMTTTTLPVTEETTKKDTPVEFETEEKPLEKPKEKKEKDLNEIKSDYIIEANMKIVITVIRATN
ncbi:leucine-rich repeat, immunoglobulin-like domain and transmembrane domain-containing protein 3 [Halyomorpha halys]|uniref:leucine-rich repeat, immunoglobulin-like domain and transmembrane domain-containing protein 3 n=1 Tax=Halyomorpha halys TaxID=286706 RepID=UPI0006D4D29F